MKAMARVMLVLMLVFSVVHAFDFVVNGQKLQSALASVGFGLMAYGFWRNPADGWAADGKPLVRDPLARTLSVVGIVMVLLSFVLRWSGVLE